MASEDRYVFLADWYDQQSSLMRKFYISYFPSDQTLEIVTHTNIKSTVYIVRSEKQASVSETHEVPSDRRRRSVRGRHRNRVFETIQTDGVWGRIHQEGVRSIVSPGEDVRNDKARVVCQHRKNHTSG